MSANAAIPASCPYPESCICTLDGTDILKMQCFDYGFTRQSMPSMIAVNDFNTIKYRNTLKWTIQIQSKSYTTIVDYTFARMHLTTLDLKYNSLETVSSRAFDNITRLDSLDLSRNSLNSAGLGNLLTSLARANKGELANLASIDLSCNNIDTLITTFPDSLNKTKVLSLRGNHESIKCIFEILIHQ